MTSGGRFSTPGRKFDDVEPDPRAAQRLDSWLGNMYAHPASCRALERLDVAVAALAAFAPMQYDELYLGTLPPMDGVVVLDAALRLLYRRLVQMYAANPVPVRRLLHRSKAGKDVLARIKSGWTPPGLRRLGITPKARAGMAAAAKAAADVFESVERDGEQTVRKNGPA